MVMQIFAVLKDIPPLEEIVLSIFVDDYFRKVWIFPLKAKYETFQKFKTELKMAENQVDKKLKTLRTDNGLEFYNFEFDNFY